jgi:hypothetical protein
LVDDADPEADGAWRRSVDAVAKWLGPTDKQLTANARDVTWAVAGVPLRLAVNAHDDPIEGRRVFLRMTVPTVSRSFRGWNRVIRDVIGHVIGAVDEAVVPQSRKYVSVVRYPRENPYFGLLIQEASAGTVARFEVEFIKQNGPERDVINIRGDQVEIVTSSLRAAENLSLHYLALQPAVS